MRPPRDPAVSRSANASSRTSTARGGSGAGRRGARGLGGLPHAPGDVQVAAHIAASQRASRCVSRASAGVERLEAPGRAEQQPGRVAAAALVQGDLPAQVLHLRGLQLVQRAGLDRDQQPQRRIQRASVAFGPGRREQPLRPATGIGCQERRTLQERGRRGQPAARLGPARRTLKLRGDILIRARPWPGPGARPGDQDQPPDR